MAKVKTLINIEPKKANQTTITTVTITRINIMSSIKIIETENVMSHIKAMYQIMVSIKIMETFHTIVSFKTISPNTTIKNAIVLTFENMTIFQAIGSIQAIVSVLKL